MKAPAAMSMNRNMVKAMPPISANSAPRGMPPPVQQMQQMAYIRSAAQNERMDCVMPKARKAEKKSSGIGSFLGNITSSIASVFSSSSSK